MSYLLPQMGIPNLPPYYFSSGLFSPPECDAILEIGQKLEMAAGQTHGSKKPRRSVRSSKVGWLKWAPDTNWIFTKLAGACDDYRRVVSPLHLSGFSEPLQLTHYEAGDRGHYGWHPDMGPGSSSTRKLSLVVLLNEPEAFDGGALELFAVPGPQKAVKELGRGTLVAFASYQHHRVTPVTRGERWSLVSWVHGPAFQ